MAKQVTADRTTTDPAATLAIPSQLHGFDRLPDAAHVRQPVVEALFACSPATVWRWTRAGRIPQPRKFGERAVAWNVGELRAALAKAA